MKLLNEICKIPAVSGNEEKYIEFLKNYALNFTGNIKTDNMNNLIVRMNEEADENTIIIECGADTPGIMICGTGKDEKVSFDAVGTVSPYQLINTAVKHSGKAAGIIRTDKKPDEKLKISDLYIELNSSGGDAAADNKNKNSSDTLKAGDFCSVISSIIVDDNSRTAADDFLSSRIPSYCGLRLIEKISREKYGRNVCVLFTAQKKTGARGSKAVLGRKDMIGKFIISIGCCETGESFKLNKGCGILAKDSGTVTSHAVRKYMQETASENNIPYQINISKENQFINSMSVSGTGFLCGGINIPVSKMGQRLERASLNDIDSAVELLYRCAAR